MAEKISSQLKGMGFDTRLDAFQKFIQHFDDQGEFHEYRCDSNDERFCSHQRIELDCVIKFGNSYAVLVRHYYRSDNFPRVGASSQAFLIKREKLIVGKRVSSNDYQDAFKNSLSLDFDEIVNRRDYFYYISIRC